MRSPESWLARKHLSSRSATKLPSALTVLSVAGVVLGTATMVVVLAVSRGFREAFREAILSGEAHVVVVPLGGGVVDDPTQVVQRVRQVPGVREAEAVAQGEVTLVSKTTVAGAFLKAPAGTCTAIRLRPLMVAGVWPQAGEVIVGTALAERLKVGLTDTVAVVSFQPRRGGGLPLPHGQTLTVSGIIDLGIYQWNATIAYTTWEQGANILGLGGAASVVEATLYEPALAKSAAQKVAGAVGGPYYCLNWMDRNRSLLEMLDVHRSVMTVILTLIILVAAFNVASGLSMGVSARRREIGVLGAIGATRRFVGRVFVLEGLVIGIAGMAIGVGGGALLAWWAGRKGIMRLAPDVYQLATLPSLVKPIDLFLVGGIAAAVAVVASFYPSWKALRIDPASAIRYE